MSLAWQVSEDDIHQVLFRHSKLSCFEAASKAISEEDGRVEKAVLYYDDFEKQCEVALSEIEDILLGKGVIAGEKKCLVH
jgi:hypothetical protein